MVSQGLLIDKGIDCRSWRVGAALVVERLLVATHAEGLLGLVHHGLVVLVGVGGARGLVSGSLTGRLLIIRNDVAVGKSVNESQVRGEME